MCGCNRASMTSAVHLGLELRLLETSSRHPQPMTNAAACICASMWNITDVTESRWQRPKRGHAGATLVQIGLCDRRVLSESRNRRCYMCLVHATAVHLQGFYVCTPASCLHPCGNDWTLCCSNVTHAYGSVFLRQRTFHRQKRGSEENLGCARKKLVSFDTFECH